ncbi:hypothetical protein D3C87_1749330 [compost metagenome]
MSYITEVLGPFFEVFDSFRRLIYNASASHTDDLSDMTHKESRNEWMAKVVGNWMRPSGIDCVHDGYVVLAFVSIRQRDSRAECEVKRASAFNHQDGNGISRVFAGSNR